MLRASSSTRMSLRLPYLLHLTIVHVSEVARPFRVKLKLRRSFATVQDPPVRHYGGLKDQDRIFTNAYSRHDHGLKGAQVSM